MSHDLSRTIAFMANPTSNKGAGALAARRIRRRLAAEAARCSIGVRDVTRHTADESLEAAREAVAEGACALVVAGGDGMVSLGVNVVGDAHTPLGIIPTGSGNDFARALGVPLTDERSAIHGIVGGLARGTSVRVDLGAVYSAQGSGAAGPAGDSAARDRGWWMADEDEFDPETARMLDEAAAEAEAGYSDEQLARARVVRRVEPHLFAGMLSCGLDANVNLMANRSNLPTGTLRYLDAVLYQLRHMTRYGFHVEAEAEDGARISRDIVTPMFTIANSRYIGSGIGISPYSRLDDGLLDMLWLNHTPTVAEISRALPHLYDGRLLESGLFEWVRVRGVVVGHCPEGATPPVLMADGDEAGVAPVWVMPRPGALRVLMPPAAARAFTLSERAR